MENPISNNGDNFFVPMTVLPIVLIFFFLAMGMFSIANMMTVRKNVTQFQNDFSRATYARMSKIDYAKSVEALATGWVTDEDKNNPLYEIEDNVLKIGEESYNLYKHLLRGYSYDKLYYYFIKRSSPTAISLYEIQPSGEMSILKSFTQKHGSQTSGMRISDLNAILSERVGLKVDLSKDSFEYSSSGNTNSFTTVNSANINRYVDSGVCIGVVKGVTINSLTARGHKFNDIKMFTMRRN